MIVRHSMPARTGNEPMLLALRSAHAGLYHRGAIIPARVVSIPSPMNKPVPTSTSSVSLTAPFLVDPRALRAVLPSILNGVPSGLMAVRWIAWWSDDELPLVVLEVEGISAS